MPRDYISVTISREIYEYAKDIMKRHKSKLRMRRVKSLSDLFEDAILFYAKKVLGETPEEARE